ATHDPYEDLRAEHEAVVRAQRERRMAMFDAPVTKRVLQCRRRDPRHTGSPHPQTNKRPVKAIDDRCQRAPAVSTTKDGRRIDGPPCVRLLDPRDPALDPRALATRALPDLPPIPLQNAM